MAKEFTAVSVSKEEYTFFKQFTEMLSNEVGIELRMAQALKMAVTQYEVKHKMTGQELPITGNETKA